MDMVEGLKAAGDLSVTALLVVVLWQGLKRFDLLLHLVISLAARSKLSTDEIEQIRAQVFGSNGKQK